MKLSPPFPAYIGDKNFIFISYAHLDKEKVYPLMKLLHDEGIRIWYDEGIPISESWKKVIGEAIDKCTVFPQRMEQILRRFSIV